MSPDRAAWLLDQLQTERVRVTPRERLAVAQAVMTLAPDDDTLAAMVASLVTHTEADWQRVYGRALELLPMWRPKEQSPARGRPDRLMAGLGLGFAVYVALMATGWALTREGGEPPEVSSGGRDATVVAVSPPEVTTPEVTPPPEGSPTPATTPAADPAPLVLVSPARVSPAELRRETTTPPRRAGVFVFSCVLLALGLTLLVAPFARAQRIIAQVRAAREEADNLYREGRQGTLTLAIPRAECLGREALSSAATSLSRQALEHQSPHLDIPATVDHTAREAGRLIPHHLPALGGPPLLLWIDVERGDHPLLWAVEAMLDRWTKEGLPFVRLHYAYAPGLFTDPLTGRRWPLADIGRRYAGAPLLLFTRLTSPQGFFGESDWPRQLSPWPRRALIDLNPLHRAPRWLRRAGLVWFPFSDDGLKAAASLLARGERLGPPPAPPKLPSVSALRAPLQRWAIAAACVPNPTWPQLEALRAGIPELKQSLPDPRLVQHLIELLRQPDGGEPCSDDGVSLVLLRGDMARLLASQRGPDGRPSALEEASLRLLIQQLTAAQPPKKDTLAEWRRRLRVACYELTLGERTLEQVLVEFGESPVRDELERRLAQEARVRVEAGADERENAVISAEGPLSLWEVAAWGRVSTWWQLGGAVVLSALGLSVGWLGAPGEVVRRAVTVELPEEWELLEEWEVVEPAIVDTPEQSTETLPFERQPSTSLRPALVHIPSGAFFMGSPEEARTWEGSRYAVEDELPQRELTIPAFELCKTEVTQANYEAVMGTNPSICANGCGDDLPVQQVSWYDAVAYLNRLTELESEVLVALGEAPLTACYEVNGEDVTWVRGCTGYRLPTEAEWEYAARAGTMTSWSFGEDPAVAGDFAWYSGNSGDKVHAVGTKKANPWGLYDMHGNVWESVWDLNNTYKRGKIVNSFGIGRGLRGGSFYDSPRRLRSAGRASDYPNIRNWSVGLRCARGPGPQR